MNDFDPTNAAAEIDHLRATNGLLLDLIERLRANAPDGLASDLATDLAVLDRDDARAADLNLPRLIEIIEAAARGEQESAPAAREIAALLVQASPERLSTLKLQALLADPEALHAVAERERRGTYRVYAERQGIRGGSFQIDAAGPAAAVVHAIDDLGFTPDEIVHVEVDAA